MNKYFVIYNAAGEILRVGDCPEEAFELQAQEGEFILEGTADCIKDAVDTATKTVIAGGNPNPQAPFTPPPVQQAPALATEKQLDLLWQAMDAGTFPKAEPFYSAVKAAKEAQA
jgi:hypothetical protein